MKKKYLVSICLCLGLLNILKVQAYEEKEAVDTKVELAAVNADGKLIPNTSANRGAILGHTSTHVYKTVTVTSPEVKEDVTYYYEEYNGFFQSWYGGELQIKDQKVTESGKHKTTYFGYINYIPKPTMFEYQKK